MPGKHKAKEVLLILMIAEVIREGLFMVFIFMKATTFVIKK